MPSKPGTAWSAASAGAVISMPIPDNVRPATEISTSMYPSYGMESPLAAFKRSQWQGRAGPSRGRRWRWKKWLVTVVTMEPVSRTKGTPTPAMRRVVVGQRPTNRGRSGAGSGPSGCVTPPAREPVGAEGTRFPMPVGGPLEPGPGRAGPTPGHARVP